MLVSGEKKQRVIFRAGIFLVAFSLLLFFLIFYPVIKTEIGFLFSAKKPDVKIGLVGAGNEVSGDVIIPASSDFSLIIPKLEINSKVVANVDPFSAKDYREALKEGIAHAKGTRLPGEDGNIFMFAHSSGNFYDTNRTNTLFFLLNKLEKDDKLSVVYKNKIFRYQVAEKKIVAGDAVEYLKDERDEESLTLMTCWPPGTDYERLIVVAEKV
ncbi:MAG: sortase [Parcubacteria group bacterium]|jgi:sortase A